MKRFELWVELGFCCANFCAYSVSHHWYNLGAGILIGGLFLWLLSELEN
jgi:hypothetical protein